jgi:hypothetical protein
LFHGAGNHLGFEVANRPGSDLDNRRAGLAQLPGVVVRGKVANDDAGLELRAEDADSFPQECGFTRARGREDVQHQQPARMEEAAVAFGKPVVFGEDGLPHLYGAARFSSHVSARGESAWQFEILLEFVRVRMWMVMVMSVMVIMLVDMIMGMMVVVMMRVFVIVLMLVIILVPVGANPHRVFSGQTAAAISAHNQAPVRLCSFVISLFISFPISIEANSISRPARRSPLNPWQAGHSANISSA